MESTIVSQSFLTASREMLAAQLALLDQSTLAKLLKSKAADLFSEEKGEFNRIVNESARRLIGEAPGELVLRIFGILNVILEIPPRQYVAPRDFEDNCEDILSRCLEVLRETEPDFTGTDLQDMLRFVMNKMFGEIGKRFESLSSDKQQQVVDEVRKFIETLPEAQKEQLQKELGSDQITDGYIRKTIVSGTLSTAFAAAVSVGGFAFYTGAVSLLAALAGLVGITLPFSFYIGLTSTIAVISNPLFVVPVLAGGGWWLYGHQNHKMRRRLAPLVVVQSVLAHLAWRSNGVDHSDQALGLWQAAWAAVEQRRTELAGAEAALACTRNELSRTKEAIRLLNGRRTQLGTDLDQIRLDLKRLCTAAAADIAHSAWGASIREPGQRLKNCLDAVDTSRNRPVRPGVSGVFDRMKRTADTWGAEQKADLAAVSTASAVLVADYGGTSVYPPDVDDLVRRHAAAQIKRKELDTELAEANKKRTGLEQRETAEQQVLGQGQSERERAEARYWGLSDIK